MSTKSLLICSLDSSYDTEHTLSSSAPTTALRANFLEPPERFRDQSVHSGITHEAKAVPVATPGSVAIDITPLEDRLEQLSKTMVSKTDLEPVLQELQKLRDERMKEAEETLDNVTVLLEKGLALTEMTASLKQIEAHLEEIVTPPKK